MSGVLHIPERALMAGLLTICGELKSINLPSEELKPAYSLLRDVQGSGCPRHGRMHYQGADNFIQ